MRRVVDVVLCKKYSLSVGVLVDVVVCKKVCFRCRWRGWWMWCVKKSVLYVLVWVQGWWLCEKCILGVVWCWYVFFYFLFEGTHSCFESMTQQPHIWYKIFLCDCCELGGTHYFKCVPMDFNVSVRTHIRLDMNPLKSQKMY